MEKPDREKIIIIDNSIAVTGALKAILNASSQLAGFEFIYILPEHSTAITLVKERGYQCYSLPFVEISKQIKNLALYLPYLFLNGLKVKRIANRHRAKIIHTNDFYNLTGIVAKALGAEVKLITHVRFLPQKFAPALATTWARLHFLYAEKLICVSKAVSGFFQKASKVEVIPDPIPAKENYDSKVINQDQGNLIHLLYLGNFIRGKGQNHALNAFSKAYQVNSSLRLTFAGGDMGLDKNKAFKQYLQNIVKESGLEEVVVFKSFVEDVEKEIKAADICLNFSESESFSLTCLDALYYGTPLIATDCGGPAELFEHNQSGILVPNKDIEAMSLAILELAASFEKRMLFSQKGKEFVKAKFNSANSFQKLNKVYMEAIAETCIPVKH